MKSFVRPDLLDSIRADANVIGGNKFRELICAVASIAAEFVVPSLGPYGGTTLMDESANVITATKDGLNSLERIAFTDPTYNVIFTMLRKISFNSAAKVGDGTTTAMITATNFLNLMYGEFIPRIEKDQKFRQADFIAASNRMASKIESELRSDKYMTAIDHDGDFSDIYKIAYIATNGNAEFAAMIQEAYQKTRNPYIRLVTDSIPETKMTTQDGYRFDCRVLNHKYYVNSNDGRIDLSAQSRPAKIIIFDHSLKYQRHKDIINELNTAGSREGTLYIIMAPFIDDIIAASIDAATKMLLQQRKMPSIMLVQIPIVTPLHNKILSDLGVIHNIRICDDNMVEAFNILHHNERVASDDDKIKSDILSSPGYSFGTSTEVLMQCLGVVNKATFSEREGFIQEFRNSENANAIKELEDETASEFKIEREKAMKVVNGTTGKDYLFAQMRYLQFKGTRATIVVGGLSDIDRKRDKDALEDAVLACRSAYEDGYVRGMNLEILQVIYDLIMSEAYSGYDAAVLDLLYKAFYYTSLSVMNNKEPNNDISRTVKVMTVIPPQFSIVPRRMIPAEEVPTDKVMRNPDVIDFALAEKERYDYDLREEMMHPKGYWKVINSTSTDIEILKSVISILTTAMTSYQFISTTHRFDPIINNETTLQRQIRELRKVESEKVEAILSTLNSEEGDKLLIKLGSAFATAFADIMSGPDISEEELAAMQSNDTALADE